MNADKARKLEGAAILSNRRILMADAYRLIQDSATAGVSGCRWNFPDGKRPGHATLCGIIRLLRLDGFAVEFPDGPDGTWLDISWE